MSPSFDPETLKALYPDTPPWGVYLAMQIHDLKQTVLGKASWTPKDIGIVLTAIAGVIAAGKGTGLV